MRKLLVIFYIIICTFGLTNKTESKINNVILKCPTDIPHEYLYEQGDTILEIMLMTDFYHISNSTNHQLYITKYYFMHREYLEKIEYSNDKFPLFEEGSRYLKFKAKGPYSNHKIDRQELWVQQSNDSGKLSFKKSCKLMDNSKTITEYVNDNIRYLESLRDKQLKKNKI